MQVQVVVEMTDDGRFVARAGEPFGWTADGDTQAEVVEKLRERIVRAAIVTLDVPSGGNLWPDVAGSGKHLVGNPMWEEYKKILAENRQRSDEEDRLADEQAEREAAEPATAAGAVGS